MEPLPGSEPMLSVMRIERGFSSAVCSLELSMSSVNATRWTPCSGFFSESMRCTSGGASSSSG
eukprot:7390520-Prymnesium_polylepis.1